MLKIFTYSNKICCKSVSTFYKFDFIVCNPPYISSEEYKNLEKDLYYEPKISLIAPSNGYFYLKN